MHQNLVLAETVLLNDRLADSELINAVADCLNGLRHGAILQIGHVLRLHGENPGIFGARSQIVLRQAVIHNVAQVRTGFRGHPFQHNLIGIIRRIGLGNFVVIDLAGAQFFLQPIHGTIGVSVNGIVHLHLKDQVCAALQVKAQMNAIL